MSMSYAIVKTGGKQYRVEQGQSLLVERLPVGDGESVQLEPLLYVDGSEIVDGEGLLALPAFVDPHVHFRVPGQEHKEDLETGTRSAAAGGYCAVIAMAPTRMNPAWATEEYASIRFTFVWAIATTLPKTIETPAMT